MPHHLQVAIRSLIALVISVCALSSSACSAPIAPAPNTSQGASAEVVFKPLYDAIVASDPRAERALAGMSQSGASRVLSVSVLLTGDEPVSTETLTALLVAVEGSSIAFDQLDLNTRSATNAEKILDLTAAIDGLPGDVTVLALDGGLTIMRADLDEFAG